MIPAGKLAQKRAKLRCKRSGTPVTLHWQEWPDGPPAVDPTTGAYYTAGSTPANAHELTVNAFVHITGPITSGYRKFAEIQPGDAIVDFPLDLIRVSDPGDTYLAANGVISELALYAANRLSTVAATGAVVSPASLGNLRLEFGGHSWAQKEVGEELANNWDTLYSNIHINRALLVRKL